jgi:hypothetical protein
MGHRATMSNFCAWMTIFGPKRRRHLSTSCKGFKRKESTSQSSFFYQMSPGSQTNWIGCTELCILVHRLCDAINLGEAERLSWHLDQKVDVHRSGEISCPHL